MNYAARTDVGLVRANNEDSYLIDEADGEKIFIVADGMGGHNAGEVASLEACRKIDGYIKGHDYAPEELVRKAVESANREIFIHAMQNEAMRGMGTTVEVCVMSGNDLTIGHVGDSRVYVISKDGMRRVTRDHSVVEEMVAAGSITLEEARVHPQRNYITRAVGSMYTVEVDVIKKTLNPGDIVLMCTDGLTSMVTNDDILRIVREKEQMPLIADALIDEAKKNGGRDNITLIVFGTECENEADGRDSQ
ncbi:MAG: Stp1/IreP family PP2C-type Ser/Thr phosphatase [Clostridia bacterium]|nr:Stp1/IreP family PP2C-type Ser/Thr phosphatase [Clostridia bacterium]